MKPGYKFHSA